MGMVEQRTMRALAVGKNIEKESTLREQVKISPPLSRPDPWEEECKIVAKVKGSEAPPTSSLYRNHEGRVVRLNQGGGPVKSGVEPKARMLKPGTFRCVPLASRAAARTMLEAKKMHRNIVNVVECGPEPSLPPELVSFFTDHLRQLWEVWKVSVQGSEAKEPEQSIHSTPRPGLGVTFFHSASYDVRTSANICIFCERTT
jgi:hypothetical protein